MDDQARALAIVAALLIGASSSAGFVGGRMSAPEPTAEVRLVRLPPRVLRVLPAEPPVELPAAPEAAAPPAPSAPAATVEATPVPLPRPKVEAKPKDQPKVQARPQPKPEKDAPARKPRHLPPANKALPSCAIVKREFEAMTWPERMSAYHRASPDEIAHGKRCLGF